MSLTESETATVRDCVKQLTDCAEYLKKSCEHIENDLKDGTEATTNTTITATANASDKKEHSREYEKIRKLIKKTYKDVKQKLHNIGKSIKDSDDIALEVSSVAEEDPSDDQISSDRSVSSKMESNTATTSAVTVTATTTAATITATPTAATIPSATIETPVNTATTNGEMAIAEQPVENGLGSPEFLVNGKGNEASSAVTIIEDTKPKISLVAIEKLLDPKVIASTSKKTSTMPFTPPPTTLKPHFNLNMPASIIILDSDEDTPEPIAQAIQPLPDKRVTDKQADKAATAENRRIPKVKPLKIRINRCKLAEDLLKSGKRKINVSKISSVPGPKNSDSSDDTVFAESRRRKKRRFASPSTSGASKQSCSSSDDSDFCPSRNKKTASGSQRRMERERRKSRSTHTSEEDRRRKRRKEKEKRSKRRDEPSTSRETDRESEASSGRSKSAVKDNRAGKSKNKANLSSTNEDDIELQLRAMESGNMGGGTNKSARGSNAIESSSKSTKSDSDKENRSKKAGANKRPKPDEVSSGDEAISNLKKRIVEKRVVTDGDDEEEEKDDENDGNNSVNNSSDSSDEEVVNIRKKHSRRKRIRTSSASDSDWKGNGSQGEKDSDDDDESDDDERGKKHGSGKKKGAAKKDGGADADTPTTRKQIRHVIKEKNLVDETKKATEAEKERRKRVEERQKLYNQIFEKPESTEIDKAVLDFDPETKEELLSIDKGLLKKLKPHQVQGIKFMWDACFETLKDTRENPGSGCILGHCMGLGKTAQVVALAHTLLANNDKTNIRTVLIITPLSTVTNWAKEFHMWIRYCKYRDVEVYDMSKFKDKKLRVYKLREWQEDGGVCILGYDMYRILANPKGAGGKKMRESLQTSLVDPGPDLIVCDEGHLLKNEKTSISKAVSSVRTQRRIVLSGTPLQNNLKEYYCMVQFVKPNLLGTYKEYLNRFVNPITNGQYTDSTERDIRLMKNRSHVLHKMLEGCIQRRDYSVLAPYLPPKHEYVVFIVLSEIQKKLYEHYMKNERSVDHATGGQGKGTALFKDFQNLRRIWTHPMALRVNSEEVKKKKERKALLEEEEDSMDDFINDDSDDYESESDSSNSSGSDITKSSGKSKKKKEKAKRKSSKSARRTRQNPSLAVENEIEEEEEDEPICESEWWKSICSESELKNIYHSPKLFLLFEILQECEMIGDKVLVFSQSLQSLNVIEEFLAMIDLKTQGEKVECDVNGFIGSWKSGLDYFRLDGSNTVESREHMCRRFNNVDDLRARLFLISTRAGSLGINLVAANRVIIFDASWNPSHDTQSIFRVYRFGQEKPCYIYRFIAKGTMEEKIYERQVMKQATAKRVIDEHQIGRHYNSNDLMELYQYDLELSDVREVPILPKDRLFADLVKKHEKFIYNHHEHDSLLENKESENLNEEERKAAWAEYENEKNRPASSQYVAYSRPNYRNGPLTSSKIFGFRSDVLLRLLNLKVRQDHPHLLEAEIHTMVPLYLRQLYEQMSNGNPTLFNELNQLNMAFEMPNAAIAAAYGMTAGALPAQPMYSNYIINPFAQAQAAQNAEPAVIHEID